jgi:hypothetical protein
MARCTGGVLGHRQVSDEYLLTAAARGGARLLTFDQDIVQLLATEARRRRHVRVLGGRVSARQGRIVARCSASTSASTRIGLVT